MPTSAIIALILFNLLLAAVLMLRPAITVHPGGKILAFGMLFFLPLFCLTAGMNNEMERSKSTSFCLSCHIMEPYGKSLRVDDPSYLAAAHYQNHRVPADEACYTCHTNYAMFETFKATLGGLRHLYVHYLKTEPRPQDIQLHEPYNNRECLHCHLGARSFEEGAVHTADPDLLPAVKANKRSCLSSGCHDVVHNVGELSKVKFWKGGT